jgi:hypothetical protein
MSDKVFVVETDPPTKSRRGLPPQGWGEFLLYWDGRDETASALGVTPLTQFIRTLSPQEQDEIAQFVAFALKKPVDSPPQESWEPPWSDPADGLTTVRALMGFVRDHSSEIPWEERAETPKDMVDGIIHDLECLQTHLVAAQKRGARFYLDTA